MSRSVDLFISSDEPLDTVASRIAELAKVELLAGDGRAGEGPAVEIREGDTTVTLREQHYIDDGDLFLSRYPYVLTGHVPSTTRPQDTPVAALLRHVGSALQQGTAWAVLLVLDLQYREQLNGTLPPGAHAGPDPRADSDDASPPDGAAPAK